MSSLQQFIDRLKNDQPVEFEDCISIIDQHYDFTPAAFTNGEVQNAAGENNGSCKILAFAALHSLSKQQALRCFGKYYQDVVATPEGTDHSNIRALQKNGVAAVRFEQIPLSRK